MSVVSVMY